MAAKIEAVRDFAMQIEKTLAARRLYQPANAAFRDASDRLLEKCRTAAGTDGFSLTVASADLLLEKVSLLHRPSADESFFFPLYRDGLRELTFLPDVAPADLEKLIAVLEVKERDIPPGDDMVTLLWRADLESIDHIAVDGIGDIEGTEGNELQGLIADLADMISNPAPASTGQSYAFVLDADVKVAAHDFHYDRTTVHRPFEDNPAILRLTEDEAGLMRIELQQDRDRLLVDRFIEILLIIARSPNRAVDPAAIAPVFQQIAEGYWNARDYARVSSILMDVSKASAEAPSPEFRNRLADVVRRFVTPERLNLLMLDFVGGALPLDLITRFWDFAPDDVTWPILLDTWSRIPEGETRATLLAALRRQMGTNLDLLRQTLASPEAPRVRAALALLDERSERLFADDVLRLTSHADESVRVKGLGAAARFATPAAREALWKAMESDPSKSVRLYALRAISGAKWPELAPRLQALVGDPSFDQRPAWEREKYVRLLGAIAGDDVAPLFESWIPSKRWMWQTRDLEQLEVALAGLASTGPKGMERVRQIENAGGKPAEVARRVLASAPPVAEGSAARAAGRS